MRRLLAGLSLAIAATAGAAVGTWVRSADAAAFFAWEISGVDWGDTLNVRKYPSATSQKQAAYPNGTALQMTGRCTGGLDLDDIAHLSGPVQAAQVRYRWCEIWHDPARNGAHVTGWVYGRYIRPA